MTEILPIFDSVAIAWFIATVGAFELAYTHPRFYGASISAAVQKQRNAWMERMSRCDNRIYDAQLMGWLSNANAFFASTSVIAIGGMAALIGYGDKARTILEALPFADKTPDALWEIKVIFLMSLMTFAFFKFAWAFRLANYTVIMMGATPAHDVEDKNLLHDHARRTAGLLGLVGEHSNRGLRSFYYTIAGLLWFYHPLAFMAATAWVVLILLRREYWSHSLRIIRGDRPDDIAHPH